MKLKQKMELKKKMKCENGTRWVADSIAQSFLEMETWMEIVNGKTK